MKHSDNFLMLSAVSLGCILALLVGIWLKTLHQQRAAAKFEQLDTLLLGTSLVKFASPDATGGNILTDNGDKKFLRVGINGGNEFQLFDISTLAAAKGLNTILIEVNPIVSRFANQSTLCVALWLKAGLLTNPWYIDFRSPFGGGAQNIYEFRKQTLLHDAIKRNYPLQIVEPCYESDWKALIQDFPNTKFVFLLMPRRTLAYNSIGESTMAEFISSSIAFTTRIGAELFILDPEFNWGDENFADLAHFSRKGSVKFQHELSKWLYSIE